MFRKLAYVTFVWPISRTVRLVSGLSRNGRLMGRALKRGITTNPKRNAPVSPGMTTDQVEELDRWWSTLTPREQAEVWAEHDRQLEQIARDLERQGKGIWSLTQDESKRLEALERQGLSYFLWMSIFFGYLAAFILTILFGSPSLMFFMMSLCFLLFIAPQVLGLRVMRGQLLYGRKLRYSEFFRPLPNTLQPAPHSPASHEEIA